MNQQITKSRKKVNNLHSRQEPFIWRNGSFLYFGNPVFCWSAAMSVNRKMHSIHSALGDSSWRIEFNSAPWILHLPAVWFYLRLTSFTNLRLVYDLFICSLEVHKIRSGGKRSRLSTSCGGGLAFKMSSILGKIPKFTLKLPSALAKAGRTMSECPLVSSLLISYPFLKYF